MVKGIDISQWQTNVNYSKLKEQGIEFAIIRCGYGKNSSQKDKMFETHYKGLKQAGIKVGCYLYSYCDKVENAVLEAQNCLNFIKGKIFELPVFYDLEDKMTAPLGRDQITQIAVNFCNTIKNAGYDVGVYANLNWFTNYIDISKLSDFKIWLAEWEVNSPKINCDIWQYADNGNVEGISGNVDMNYLISEDIETQTNNENVSNGGEEEVKIYKNGSTVEPVYSNLNCTNKIGSLNTYEQCDCFGIFNNRAIVRYKVDGTNDYKIGFVKWLGGVQN